MATTFNCSKRCSFTYAIVEKLRLSDVVHTASYIISSEIWHRSSDWSWSSLAWPTIVIIIITIMTFNYTTPYLTVRKLKGAGTLDFWKIKLIPVNHGENRRTTVNQFTHSQPQPQLNSPCFLDVKETLLLLFRKKWFSSKNIGSATVNSRVKVKCSRPTS